MGPFVPQGSEGEATPLAFWHYSPLSVQFLSDVPDLVTLDIHPHLGHTVSDEVLDKARGFLKTALPADKVP